jgi:hypothetical protein
MTSRKNGLSLIGGVVAFLLVLAPSAFAKHSGGGGRQATVDCGDGVISYSPSTLWPPNHKMKQIDISFAEAQPEGVADSGSETLGLQITNITSSQQAEDDAGTGGCGPDTATQGPDFTFDSTPVVGPTGDDTVTVSTSVDVRAERCAQDKTPRQYTIDVTCSDEGTTDSVQLFVTVGHDKGKKH